MNIEELFFELLRVAIGNQVFLSHTPCADEWGELYAMAKKQSLVGVCFAGVQRLQSQRQAPNSWGNEQGELLYLQWMGMAAKIQQKNEVLNAQCVTLQAQLTSEGMHSCILNGQGNAALYYPWLTLLRQSGDIDVWIEGGRDSVLNYVQSVCPTEDVRDNHAALNVFKDTEVEAHFRPATLRNPFKNKNLQSFFEKEGQACFLNSIELKGGTISVPTCEFNLVYQLVHIFEHFYTEGVGLRQVMDYYFVLRTVMNGTEGSGRYREAKKVISGLGLDRFASALMWVIKTFIGHDNTSTSSAQADYGNFFLGNRTKRTVGSCLMRSCCRETSGNKTIGRKECTILSGVHSGWCI